MREVTVREAARRTEPIRDTPYIAPATASFLTTSTGHKSNKGPRMNQDRQITTTQSTSIREKPCIFCTGMHDPTKCTSVKDYPERIKIVKEKKLCFNCLGRHRLTDCKSRHRCRQCNKKHHTSICNEKNTQETSVKVVVEEESVQSAVSLHSSTIQSRSNVLLKTAVAPVWSESQYMDTNILFDEGAQRSFITEEFASKMNIEPYETETIQLSAFGSTNNKVRGLQKARLYVETLYIVRREDSHRSVNSANYCKPAYKLHEEQFTAIRSS